LADAAKTNKVSAGESPGKSPTNTVASGKGTNAIAKADAAKNGTNVAGVGTNVAAVPKSMTNSSGPADGVNLANRGSPLPGAMPPPGGPAAMPGPGGAPMVASPPGAGPGPGGFPGGGPPPGMGPGGRRAGRGMPGAGMMPGMMMPGGGGKPPADLPAAAQAQIERITQSEIFAPVMHPMPMALLGIAGRSAFLRAPSGQTGLVKEGDELGGIKLLRIGTNRVLVQENGQSKELTIFSGFGSDSLMPKGKESSQ